MRRYQWFEPLLVEHVHYLRTDIDGLNATLRALPSDEVLRAIGERAQNAARLLFTKNTTDCFALLASKAYASHQAETLAAAAQVPWAES